MVTNPNKLAEISAFGPARATVEGTPLSAEELHNRCVLARLLLFNSRNALSERESVAAGAT